MVHLTIGSIASGNGLTQNRRQAITWRNVDVRTLTYTCLTGFLWRNIVIAIIIICVCMLQWRHNGRDSVSNHQPHDCLLNRLFRRRSKKASKLRDTGLCAGNYRWIPRTNGQLCGKCFHLMTSSWVYENWTYHSWNNGTRMYCYVFINPIWFNNRLFSFTIQANFH